MADGSDAMSPINCPRPSSSEGSLLERAVPNDGPGAIPLWRIVSDSGRVEALYGLLGEFCHAFRNRLNSFHLCLYLAQPDGPTPEDRDRPGLEDGYRDVLHHIDLIQMICRPMQLDRMPLDLGLMVEDRVDGWSRAFARRGVLLESVAPGRPAEGSLDPMWMTRALDELAEWRSRTAAPGGVVTIRWRESGGDLGLTWEETPGPADLVPDPGRADDGPGCLALALLARVVLEHGGTIDADESEGLRVELRWPGRVRGRAGRARDPSTGTAHA